MSTGRPPLVAERPARSLTPDGRWPNVITVTVQLPIAAGLIRTRSPLTMPDRLVSEPLRHGHRAVTASGKDACTLRTYSRQRRSMFLTA